MKPAVNIYRLGRLPYLEALTVQQVLFDKLKKSVTSIISKQCYESDSSSKQQDESNSPARNSMILIEHEPVYTVGIRSKQYDDNYVSKLKKELDFHKLKADFVRTNRGGLITFHGPGQLVAYPIIYLGDFTKTIHDKSVKAYVNLLEATIVDTLAMVGINGAHTVREYPGVWLDNGERKIAFIGISCKRYVTMHGISINCNCDLSWFDHIVSCGIEDKSITSIHRELSLEGRLAGQGNHHSRQLIFEESDDCMGINLKTTSYRSESSVSGEGLEFNRTCPDSNVDYISRAFCQSFSHHFDCNLIESPHGDTTILS